MDQQFKKQIQQEARDRLSEQLPHWLTEASRKDMNSVQALSDVIGRVFIRGVLIGVELALKIHKGEL